MRTLVILIALAMLLTTTTATAATTSMSPDSIRRHIAILAADSLEGRATGEIGETKAAAYLVSVFESLGLEPRGDSGSFLQAFNFVKSISLGPDNELVVNGQALVPNEDFRPLAHSASITFDFDSIVSVGYGITTADFSHDDYAGLDVSGRAVLIKRYAPLPESQNDSTLSDSAAAEADADTTFERYSSLASKIMTAIDNQVTGLFFYTPTDYDDTLLAAQVLHLRPKNIPIIFLSRAGLTKLGLDLDDPRVTSASGTTALVRQHDTGYNVVAYLPGETDSTIILGAHYDHIGWGGHSSRYREPEPKIHNGADDNGSGVAAILELARLHAGAKTPLRHSLLYIAFSGEEIGLLGSGHFVRHWTVPKAQSTMMINLDMIGRLADQEKGLAIMGTGTCLEFKDYFDSLPPSDLKMVFKESGSGPSDHTAFYNDSLPCLFFFTGAHQDYHTPEDDVDKIDLDGIVSVATLIDNVVRHFDVADGPLTFQRTKDKGHGRSGRSGLTVALGIMPDFITEVDGLAIDGVTPEQPGDRAGMLKGDVIIKIGGRTVGDIYDYMGCLKKYRKGDSTLITLVRDSDTLVVMVNFEP